MKRFHHRIIYCDRLVFSAVARESDLPVNAIL